MLDPDRLTDVWLMSMWSTGDLLHYGDGCWVRSGKVFQHARQRWRPFKNQGDCVSAAGR
jgi:hypothetical protein